MTSQEATPFPWASPKLRERLIGEPLSILREYGVNLPANIPIRAMYDAINIVSLLWVDGQIVPREQFHIDPMDEGLLFGKGVWESTRVDNGQPFLWHHHIDRLIQTAQLLGMEVSSLRLPTAEQVREYVTAVTGLRVLVRLNVSAGSIGLPGQVWMSLSLPPMPVESIRLQTQQRNVQKDQPFLTWKTFQYATRLNINQVAKRNNFDGSLLIDGEGFILEAAHANVFIRLADGWVTPSADGGLLPGTLRHHLLTKSPIRIREGRVPLASLKYATEIFASNSNTGIVPISQVDEQTFSIGEDTRQLIRWLGLPG